MRASTCLSTIFVAGFTACTPAPPTTAPPAAAPQPPSIEIVERWESPRTPEDDVDSLAFWQNAEGAWVFATTKATHRLNVYDAATGKLARTIGGPGTELGQFQRPNGIAAIDGWLLVVERDNARVQVLRLPGGEPLGTIGAGTLRRPYGLTVFAHTEGGYELFVSDNYETAAGEIPPPAELGERVEHFRFRIEGDQIASEQVRSFGATDGEGALQKVETLLADPALGRLLVAEELEGELAYQVYGLGGNYTGEAMGRGAFLYEPEGLALYRCGEDGYWIGTDQAKDKSYFRIFERKSLKLLGTVTGRLTANTDGIVLTQEAFPGFPDGALFAVHDDQSVTVFDWREIAAALGLETGCIG